MRHSCLKKLEAILTLVNFFRFVVILVLVGDFFRFVVILVLLTDLKFD